MYKRFRNIFLSFCFVIILSFTQSVDVRALSIYTMEDYTCVINNINTEYGLNIQITDMDTFNKNIFNVISPGEFENMLLSSSTEVPSELSLRAAPIEKKYYADIFHGTWQSRLNGVFLMNYNASDNSPYFISLVSAGCAWDDNWTSWLFKAESIVCTSFSSSSCTLSYNGCWMIPATGVTDLTWITYTITYYPN